jgi:hypothetical protein
MSPDCSEKEKGEGDREEWTRREKGIEGREGEVKKGGIGQVEGREERRGERRGEKRDDNKSGLED